MMKRMIGIGLTLILTCGQIVFANNGTVTPPPGPLFQLSGVGNNFSIKTTTPGWIYENVGVQFSTPGFFATQCTVENNFCSFTTSDANPHTIVISGPRGLGAFKLCLNSTHKGYSCEKHMVSNRFAYVTTNGGPPGTIYLCPINSNTGAINSTCTLQANVVATGSFIKGIAVDPTGTFLLYSLPGHDAVSAQGVGHCTIDQITGTLGNCGFSTITPAVANSYVTDIAIDSSGKFAYLTGTWADEVQSCAINPTTLNLESCGDSAATQGLFTEGIAVGALGRHVYTVAFENPGIVYMCDTNQQNGAITNCVNAFPVNTPSSIQAPTGIAINIVGLKGYIMNTNPVGLTICNIDPVTDLFIASSCITQNIAQFNNPNYIKLNATNDKLYISESGSGKVTMCPLNPIDGTLVAASCVDSSPTVMTNAYGIGLL